MSHRGWEGAGAPIVHTVAPTQGLDKKPAGQRLQKSPHDLLQLYLNVARDDTWAILSNGLFLRLLRTFHHTYTKGFVEFDLEGIFEARNFTDFRALYRLIHASRFIPNKDEVLPLERFYKDSLAAGIAVGTNLQKQVLEAIETLANGFLGGEMINQLQENEEAIKSFYGEILYLIYRIIFLLFSEQRGLMPGRTSLYAGQYSITRLRDLAMRNTTLADHHSDLWEGLKVTFRMLQKGVPELDIYGYNGMLFSIEKTPILERLACSNTDLLRAIRFLTLIEKDKVLQRISYLDLGVEEIGSIYESLLEYTPRLSAGQETIDKRTIPANRFFLDPRGTTRKTTGSYYTNPQLVNELIKSALVPIVRDRLEKAGLPLFPSKQGGDVQEPLCDYSSLTAPQKATGEKALLHIKVCDPACGSAPFLIAAVNMMGQELARIRTQDLYPAEKDVRRARRDVLTHCIYGVDINPMAVELAKVSLWIDCAVEDQPLNFLDHHIKWGNSLIGATPELMKKGIPLEAFTAVTGDDKTIAAQIRKNHSSRQKGQNKTQKIQLSISHEKPKKESGRGLAEQYFDLIEIPEDSPAQVATKQVEYGKLITSEEYLRKKREADFWTAAFFWPLTKEQKYFPTQEMFLRLKQNPQSIDQEFLDQVEAIACAGGNRFFHWHLEFPEVFEKGGFDVVLGNPPWERIKLQEEEFFHTRAIEIAKARTAAIRRKLIQKLPVTNPALAWDYQAALRHSESTSKFIRNSNHFPLTGVGDINTYPVFTELAKHLINPHGRVGLVIPLGIATDYTYRDFFADLMNSGSLVSLHDFENREGIFPGVHRNYNFALTTLTGSDEAIRESEFSFFMTQIDHLQDNNRRFILTKEDLSLINPNTRTCPIFNTRRDADLTRKMYRACPILHNEQTDDNPWGVRFLTMFHMANDSRLFKTREQLEEDNYTLSGNHFVKQEEDGEEIYLPLYEAKMMHQFDHRHGTFGEQSVENIMRGNCRKLTPLEYTNSKTFSQPRYWIQEQKCIQAMGNWAQNHHWIIGYRRITRAVDRRTATFSILPWAGIGDNIFLITIEVPPPLVLAFLANLNSFVFDFIARQKMAGINLSFYIVKQLPIMPPISYSASLSKFINSRVLELTYTADDLNPFAKDCGYEGAPFQWEEERRSHLRAELDAVYFHLYGLQYDEIEYILDTFPIVKRKDMEKYGEYRTKRRILEYYAQYEGKIK